MRAVTAAANGPCGHAVLVTHCDLFLYAMWAPGIVIVTSFIVLAVERLIATHYYKTYERAESTCFAALSVITQVFITKNT